MDEKVSLFEDLSDSDVELKVNNWEVNEKFAKSYEVWRKKEELQKYKDLKKEDDDSESSSESEEEVPEFDEDFFRALSLLKGKDPRIYDKNFELFKDKEVSKKPKGEKDKPMYMKDYERNLVLERGGKFSDDEEEDIQSKVYTYDEEQDNLRKGFSGAQKDSDDEGDDLLQVRTKSKREEEDEEADYLKWLKGKENEVSEDVKKDMSYLRNYWNDPKLDEGEKFLRDYILNKRYLEKDDAEIPTYDEITSGMLSDDEKVLEEQEKFEHKYNFRFEEPDEEFIKRYPRTVGDSLRKADNRRKQKRDEIAERKKRDREQRKEELKRLKALKRKEIEEKFIKLKEVSGQEELNLNESDMESDFDPDKHDKKMREMFNNDYYQIEEDQKPEFAYDEELDFENWNTWTRQNVVDEDDNKVDESENDSHNDDETSEQIKEIINPQKEFEKEMIEASQPRKKVKKKSLFAKIASQPKPIYDPDGKSFEDYLDEYYKLDYEDVIGDMPVRYKYRKVIPNNFGLTVDEILTADDRELNRWCSVKKTCQYRNDEEEIYDLQAYKKKAQNVMSKKKVFSSLYTPKEIDSETGDEVNEHKNKKKKYVSEELRYNQDETGNEEVDVEEEISDDKMEHDLNQNSSIQNGKHEKVSKMKKKKGNAKNSPMNTDCLNVNSNSFEISDSQDMEKYINDNSSPSCNEYKKKTRKNKRKNKQLVSGIENESENSLKHEDLDVEAYSDRNKSELSNVEGSSSNSKRKRKFDLENSALVACSGSDRDAVVHGTPRSKLHKSKHDSPLEFSNVGESSSSTKKNSKSDRKDYGLVVYSDTESDVNKDGSLRTKLNNSKHKNASNFNKSENSKYVTENSSETPAGKKKRKRNRKNKQSPASTNFNQRNKSQTHKFKEKKHVENASGDKRLGLSDERLAAYGINPKKFKNRIVYSKK